jgi:dGTPase
VPEDIKSPDRTAFERDRARLLHSAALRRLGAKTQVRTPWRPGGGLIVDDSIRTRLTHSLEVAQVGRELGKLLGCDPDVVDTACLAHDLGHPPFGHNGELALAELSGDIGGFEGNAQTLRLLTRLEAKVVDPNLGRSVGLNLTRACLDAATKYPWPAGQAPAGADPAKFGVYEADRAVFDWLRQGAGAGLRCIEAQVMDFADDVAYSVHDVEDGVVGGSIPLSALRGRPADAVRALALAASRGRLTESDIDEAAARLAGLAAWPGDWDGSRPAQAALKDFTSQLIGRFCTSATAATRRAHGTGRLTRYSADLAVPDRTIAEIAVLKALAAHYVMAPRRNDPLYSGQRRVIAELFERLVAIAPQGLEPALAGDWLAAGGADERRRVVVDQIASLTDTSARLLHEQLVQRAT